MHRQDKTNEVYFCGIIDARLRDLCKNKKRFFTMLRAMYPVKACDFQRHFGIPKGLSWFFVSATPELSMLHLAFRGAKFEFLLRSNGESECRCCSKNHIPRAYLAKVRRCRESKVLRWRQAGCPLLDVPSCRYAPEEEKAVCVPMIHPIIDVCSCWNFNMESCSSLDFENTP